MREKVNKDGFAFSDAYFKMDADITLPDGWKPIGATKDGRVNLQKGANLNAFSGIFDGAGHTITVPEGGLPLFGYVRNTRIRNLNIYGKRLLVTDWLIILKVSVFLVVQLRLIM